MDRERKKILSPSPLKLGNRDFRRLLVVAFLLLLLFCAIIAQFYRVQIIEGEKWQKQARAQHQFTLIDPFKRGRFFVTNALKKDHPRQFYPLVIDIKYYHIHMDPLAIPLSKKDLFIRFFFDHLSLNTQQREYCLAQFAKKSRSRRIKWWVTENQKEKIEREWRIFSCKNKLPKKALYFVEDYRRSYPYGSLLGAVLGAVREDRDPITRQNIPIGGLELFFQKELSGKSGKRMLLRSPRQPLATERVLTYAQDGADIYLTIDLHVQAIVEEELTHAVNYAGAKGGWAVMMDPNTGEIYALAQCPYFDPTFYRKYYNDPAKQDYTRIRAVMDCFEPGSTFKPLSLAIGLLANQECIRRGQKVLFDPKEMIRSDDGRFPGRMHHPIRDVGGPHHFLNLELAIQKSSSIYCATIIQRIVDTLGSNWYRQQLTEVFKLGEKTGIELPGESGGFLPPISKSEYRKRNSWSKATPASLAMGYNVLVTAFQLLRAHTILLTGYDVKPTIIKAIVRGEENYIEKKEYLNSEKSLLIDPKISKEIICALQANVNGGTGRRAAIPGYTAAGKTGSAEKVVAGKYSKKCHFSSFIGFSPLENPKLLLFVGIDEPLFRFLPGIGRTYFGGMCAAPLFRRIMERTLRYIGASPDDPFGYLLGDPRSDPSRANGSLQRKTLQELYTKWNTR